MAAETSALDGVNRLTDATCVRTVMCSVPKINLHEIDLKADRPTPGSADLCLFVQDSLDDVVLGSVGVMSTVLVRSAGLARMGLSPRRMSGTLTGI